MCHVVIWQVLSESTSKALALSGGPDVQETARFVLMIDKFFDCLNVSNFDKYSKNRTSKKMMKG